MLSAICALSLLSNIGRETVTFESLLNEMTDRNEMARLAEPSYKCFQASSYDRRSLTPKDQNDWYANMDRSWFVRKEMNEGRIEHVMMDVEGPGAIVRIWTTWNGRSIVPSSILRVYLDGKDKPTIEGMVIDIVSGGALVQEPLSASVSEMTDMAHRGHNLYLPIPYSSGCKVTIEIDAEVDDGAYNSPAFYYQVNYRTYPKGTSVESFSMRALQDAKDEGAIDDAQKTLTAPFASGQGDNHSRADSKLSPNETMNLEVEGSKAITEIKLSLEAEDIEQALRSTIVEIAFDGEKTVWIPAGTLFGLGHKAAAYWSWWTSFDGETMTSRWPMPFQKTASIKLVNLGEQEIEASMTVYTDDWDWDERSLYFHAVWSPHYSIETQTGSSKAWLGAFDVNFATVRGQGKWAGDVLTLYNGAASWWGEGDEKIWVDGENFPSHIGTGTEDYYGYAWGNPNPYSHPFIAQPIGAGNNSPDAAVNVRWRSLDAVPFDKSIQFDMELWHWSKTKMNFEPASMFYARPGAVCNIMPNPEMAKMAVPKMRADVVPVQYVEGAIEAEKMEALATGGLIEHQSHAGIEWSGDLQVWWKDGSVGDELTLIFDSELVGEFEILANMTIANDYGIASFSLNGEALSQGLDLYSPSLGTKEFSLGKGTLKKTGNVLKVKIVGSNKDAILRRMVGIDYIRPTS